MKKELQDRLVTVYSEIFSEVGKTPQESCMAFGICVDDGWYWLIDQLCSHLQSNIGSYGSPQIVAVQVKEKFGGLRFYVNSATDEQFAIISFAEDLSFSICEACGSTKEVSSTDKGWIKTLCKECQEKK